MDATDMMNWLATSARVNRMVAEYLEDAMRAPAVEELPISENDEWRFELNDEE